MRIGKNIYINIYKFYFNTMLNRNSQFKKQYKYTYKTRNYSLKVIIFWDVSD